MTDKEQIEEMAKEIDDRLIEARGYLGSMNRGEGYWIAQKLVEHYQPKIPEGSVVLSEKEKTDLYVEAWNKGFAHGRKETAREILQVIKKAKENGQIYYNDAFMITAQGAYGVEVEE